MSATQEQTSIIITCLRRHPEHGYWTAHVTIDHETHRVDKRCGSWVVERPEGKVAHVLYPIASLLQKKVRRLERRERISSGELGVGAHLTEDDDA